MFINKSVQKEMRRIGFNLGFDFNSIQKFIDKVNCFLSWKDISYSEMSEDKTTSYL